MRRESIFNTVGSLALILPLLFIVFRSLWLVAVGSLPSALSLRRRARRVWDSRVRGSRRPRRARPPCCSVSASTASCCCMSRIALRSPTTTTDAVPAIAGPSSSMLLGMWTTAATFYGLMFVDFPSLQQLGPLIGHSMVVCGVLTLVMVPALLPRRPPRRIARAARCRASPRWIERRHAGVLAAAAVLTVLLGFAAVTLRVNPTLDRLRSVTDAARLEAKIGSAFGLPGDVYVVLAEGPDLEPLLQTNERLAARHLERTAGSRLAAADAAAAVSSRAGAHGRDGCGRADLAGTRAASLERARAAGGFRPGSFDPFAERLPRLLDPARTSQLRGLRGARARRSRRAIRRPRRRRLAAGHLRVSRAARAGVTRAGDRRRRRSGQTLTGLPLVNRELARRFLPQFIKGLAIGTLDRRRCSSWSRSATGGCRCSRCCRPRSVWSGPRASWRWPASSSICSRSSRS